MFLPSAGIGLRPHVLRAKTQADEAAEHLRHGWHALQQGPDQRREPGATPGAAPGLELERLRHARRQLASALHAAQVAECRAA